MSDCSCHINPPCSACTDACCGEHDGACDKAASVASACCDDCPDWKDL